MFTELCLSLVFCANVLDVLLAEDHHSLILLHASAPLRRQLAGGRGVLWSLPESKVEGLFEVIPIPSRTLPGTAPPASVRYRREARAAVRIRGD